MEVFFLIEDVYSGRACINYHEIKQLCEDAFMIYSIFIRSGEFHLRNLHFKLLLLVSLLIA